MSAPEPVTVTVDDVEVQVPRGNGLVETALAAGIEIPVFCYEPRLGPPVGACRMCLCEVAPGPPKPQAACTLTAAEGMQVKTALTSEMAADAQNREPIPPLFPTLEALPPRWRRTLGEVEGIRQRGLDVTCRVNGTTRASSG